MNNLYKGDYHGFFKYKKENKNNAIYSNNNIYYIANKIVLDSGDSRIKIKTNGTRATKFRQRNISQKWGNI